MKQLLIKLNVATLLLMVFSFHCMGSNTYTFEYKLEKGKSYMQNMVTDLNMKMDFMGQAMDMIMKSEMIIQNDVLDQSNGVFDLRTSYKRIKMSMFSPMPFTIDSDSPESFYDRSLGDVLKSLTEVSMDIKLTKLGKVISVEGADKMFEKIDAMGNEQFKQMFGQQFSEDAIKAMYNQMTPLFPEKPVAIGTSWDVTMNINAGGADVINKMILTLKEVKDNVATIECTGTIETPEGGVVVQMQGMDSNVSVNGTQSGTILIDMKSGWIVRSEITQKFTQNVEFMGQAMQQIIESKTTVTAD